MSTRYRFIAVDVDGTLVNREGRVPEANRAALHRAHEAGIMVCLCTGRTLPETRTVIDELGLDSDVGVFVFGSIVAELPAGRTIRRTTLAADTTCELVTHFADEGYPALVLYDGTQTGVDYRFVPGERNREVFELWMGMSPATFERLDAWSPIEHEPVRITIIEEPDRVDETLDWVKGSFSADQVKVNALYAPNYRLNVIECFGPEVSKWHGIQEVVGPKGIAPEEIAAIGDDVNDLEMIAAAGLGVAMGNARDAVKALADWHAPTNEECGVAAAIDAILTGNTLPAPSRV